VGENHIGPAPHPDPPPLRERECLAVQVALPNSDVPPGQDATAHMQIFSLLPWITFSTIASDDTTTGLAYTVWRPKFMPSKGVADEPNGLTGLYRVGDPRDSG
jgi:hypothetical protein